MQRFVCGGNDDFLQKRRVVWLAALGLAMCCTDVTSVWVWEWKWGVFNLSLAFCGDVRRDELGIPSLVFSLRRPWQPVRSQGYLTSTVQH